MELSMYWKAFWDRITAVVASALGLAALLIGWLGTAHAVYATEQIPYIVSGATGGLFLLGVGATLWVSADLRDEWRKLDALEDAVSKLTLTDTDVLTVSGEGHGRA